MPDPVSLQILDAIKARVDEISTANGYNTNPTVVRGVQPVNPDQSSSGPVISMYELQDQPEEATLLNQNLITLSIEVEGVVQFNDNATSEKLSYLWQDINRAVFQADTTLGGLALGVLRGPRSFQYPQPGGETVAVQQTVNVQYLETYGNP